MDMIGRLVEYYHLWEKAMQIQKCNGGLAAKNFLKDKLTTDEPQVTGRIKIKFV